MIERWYSSKMHQLIRPGKVLVLYGPRRSGKTTLIQSFLSGYEKKVWYGSGDDKILQNILESESESRITSSFKGYDLIAIDEAQRIENVGFGLKILVDSIPEVSVIASGSSSFELANKVGEPLTGRKRTIRLYPFAITELEKVMGGIGIMQDLKKMLVFGMYPEVFLAENDGESIAEITEIRDSYLFKDILELENLRNPRMLFDLLRLLAYQIGKEVSLNELSNQLGVAKQTVDRYLDLLEKVFIIKRIGGFSRNLRKEVTKTCRYYFLDNGIRNAVINNFNYPDLRDDIGMLWENFLWSERMKTREYRPIPANMYFWRTYDGREVDLVEEREGGLYGYEFKWGGKPVKAPRLWKETYPEAEFRVINQENFLEFLVP
jgi:uncharacterized protein